MLKLKLQYFGHLLQRTNSLYLFTQFIRKDPNAGKDWMQKKKEQKMRLLDNITNSTDIDLNKLQETAKDREA